MILRVRRLILMGTIWATTVGLLFIIAHSYRTVNGCVFDGRDTSLYRGQIRFIVSPAFKDRRYTYTVPVAEEDWYWNLEKADLQVSWRFCGAWHARAGKRDQVLSLPVWYFLSPQAMFVVYMARNLVRRYHRSRNGACLVCGYDLRATPTRCPECGTPAACSRRCTAAKD